MKKTEKIAASLGALWLALGLLGAAPAMALSPGDAVVPGGQVVGIQLQTDGVIVSDLADVTTETGVRRPAEAAGVRPGDRIVKLNGQPVTDGESFLAAAEALDGSAVTLELIRNGQSITLTAEPAQSQRGRWQLGLWLRDSITGIGTLTYWDPASGEYGALGHAVSLPEGGGPVAIAGGIIYQATVGAVVPGTRGVPGELQGIPSGVEVGVIGKNTPFGIFGTARQPLSQAPAVTVAATSEVTLGPAQILSTVSPQGTAAYDVEISRITRTGDGARQLTITVTDPALLALTGGIVQGMSGSPIIQDGKLVGAVTHVLVNDPTRGYGIFIENMLDAAG